ncbi:hypothetical protein QUA56_25545 [Microcoleus sp. N3A4]
MNRSKNISTDAVTYSSSQEREKNSIEVVGGTREQITLTTL